MPDASREDARVAACPVPAERPPAGKCLRSHGWAFMRARNAPRYPYTSRRLLRNPRCFLAAKRAWLRSGRWQQRAGQARTSHSRCGQELRLPAQRAVNRDHWTMAVKGEHRAVDDGSSFSQVRDQHLFTNDDQTAAETVAFARFRSSGRFNRLRARETAGPSTRARARSAG
jgi:hypothetical protein